MWNSLRDLALSTGLAGMSWETSVMLVISLVLIYLAIVKQYEPLLLLPIAFGMLLTNLPLAGMMDQPIKAAGGQLIQPGGLIYYLYQGVKLGIYPPLIFLGVGAMTDFGPLIANPKSILLGAAAQLGIFCALLGAIILGLISMPPPPLGLSAARTTDCDLSYQ